MLILGVSPVETKLKISLLFFCSQVAVLMVAGLQSKKERKRSDYRLFVATLWIICVELIADTIALIADGSGTRFWQAALRNSVFLLYAASPLVAMMYAIYVDYTTRVGGRRPRKRIALYLLPSAAIICLSFASLFTGWFFSFDGSGHQVSGRFMYVPMIVPFGYLICAIAVLIKRRKTVNSRDFASLVSFPVPIVFLGTLQSVMPDYVILLPAQVLSLLILYSNIQERRLSYDYLTGVYNRRKLDECLEAMIEESRVSGKGFAAFLGDVDHFKGINDTYGHTEGDRALVAVARTITKSLRRDDFLARYAGDEFVAILPNCDEAELREILDRIAEGFSEHATPEVGYSLSISIGGSAFDPAVDRDSESLVKRLDALMYAEKRKKA